MDAPLPPEPVVDFRSASAAAVADSRLQAAVNGAVLKQFVGRQERMRELPDAGALRTLAAQIRQHALDHLDHYLDQLRVNVEKHGGHVHFARTGEDARRIVMQIMQSSGCEHVIKSKSMLSEEVKLTPHMEAAGMDVVETDLGEFIAQISHDRPSHIVAPIIHKDRASIARLFADYFKTEYDEDPRAMTLQARAHLREKFRRADFGMTGGNFLIAETGQVVVVENEGNARQSMTTPRVLVSMVGIEKVLPRLADLSVFLKLLARSSTGQRMTVYTSIFGGPRCDGEKDGPEEFHLVLVDAGRTEILAGDYREVLRCIRCGACLNACPVFRKVSGHAYGGTYSGPIGAVLTPLMNGLGNHADLPRASSLCGACLEVCPVKIDIPHHLVRLRREIVQQKINSRFERALYRFWAWSMRTPGRYRFATWFQRLVLRRRARGSGWARRIPFPGRSWTDVRDMPAPARRSFHHLWRKKPSRQ